MSDNKVLVYRLENSDGSGVYHCNAWSRCCGGSFSSDTHPMPFHDDIMVSNFNDFFDQIKSEYDIDIEESLLNFSAYSNYQQFLFIYDGALSKVDGRRASRFGFESIESLKRWVFDPDWRSALSEYGIQISVYEIEERFVLYGESQLIFLKEQGKLVDILDVDLI